MKAELWKPVKAYEGAYEISNLGRLRSLDRWVNSKNNSKALKKGKLKKPTLNQYGYYTVRLFKNQKAKNYSMHRLVAEAFIENPKNKPQINHIDGDKQNNKAINLEWCCASENMKHAYKLELIERKQGPDANGAKFTRNQIRKIRYLHDIKKYTQVKLSKMYGVSNSIICRIVNRVTYQNVN